MSSYQEGASEAHFTFFHVKSPHFPVYLIQSKEKKTTPQNLGQYSQRPRASTIILHSKKFEKLCLKRVILSMGF